MNRSLRKPLGFERLESKQMLAGDVLVSVVGGNLHIRGDELGNQIAISSGDEAGTYIIRGIEGTTVKLAEPESPPAPETGLVVEGVRGAVIVGMGAGDDAVTVNDANFRRGLSIHTGAGADVVNVGTSLDGVELLGPSSPASVNARGSLLIRTGADNDQVVVRSAHVGGIVGIATDGGDDRVDLGVPLALNAFLPAPDGPALRARLGVDVLLGAGADRAELRHVAGAQVAVGGGLGGDEIRLHEVDAALVAVRGGDGESPDQVHLNEVRALAGIFVTGAGDDGVIVENSRFASLTVELGAGNDTLRVENVTARLAALAGGAGEADQLTEAGTNSFGRKIVTGFEIPPDVNTSPGFRPLARLVGLLRR